MNYLSLYKAHFKIDINEKELYDMRFHSPNTLHFKIPIHNKESFLYVNNELLVLIEQIHVLNSKIIKKRNEIKTDLINTWELSHSLVQEILLSNEIEGVVSTRKEINELLDMKSPKEYKRLYGMVNKYRDIFFQKKEFNPITDSSKLRKVYDDILIQDIENEEPHNLPDGILFRKENVNVVSSTKIIHQGVYPESKIIKDVDDTLSILNNSDLPYLVRVALFHYFLGYIHPFYDGNGRISRYVSSYYLSQVIDSIASLRLSIACKKRQKDYYEAFKITNDPKNNGDITYFVLTFLDIFKEGLEDYLEELTDKVNQYIYYENKLLNLTLDDTSSLILKIIVDCTLFHLKNISIKELVDMTHLSKSTISHRINLLEKANYIIRIKESRQTYFSFNLDSL